MRQSGGGGGGGGFLGLTVSTLTDGGRCARLLKGFMPAAPIARQYVVSAQPLQR